MVLLKNAGELLPLAPGVRRLAIVGPLADARRDLLGTWALFGQAEDAETVREAIQARLPKDQAVTYAPGCPHHR